VKLAHWSADQVFRRMKFAWKLGFAGEKKEFHSLAQEH
jgi:hypothetical protein